MSVVRRVIRRVICADSLVWMTENAAAPGTSVMTSLPDVSELPRLGIDGWQAWFVDVVGRIVTWTPPTGCAIFYQSDIRSAGRWIDKGYLVLRGAEAAGASLVWHKIVCRKPAGTKGLGRPSYSHMLCVTKDHSFVPKRPGADVLPDAGPMTWSRAIGATAARVACEFLREETATTTIVDPFCGRGTVLAIANCMGFDAVGIDIGGKRCRLARALDARDLLPAAVPGLDMNRESSHKIE